MPEIASIQILSSVTPAVASAAATGAAAASGGVASSGNAAPSTYPGNDANLPPGQDHASFASILKRQINQPANAAPSPADGTIDTALQGVALIASLIADQPLAQLAGNLTGLAASLQAAPTAATPQAQDAPSADGGTGDQGALIASLLASDLAGAKAERRGASGKDKTDKAMAALAMAENRAEKRGDDLPGTETTSAGLTAGALDLKQPATLTPAADNGVQAAGQDESKKVADNSAAQPQGPADTSVAALLAFFPPPSPAAQTKADIAADADGHEMPQVGQGKEEGRGALQANLADKLHAAPGKPAEIAAAQALTTETSAAPKGKEGASAEVSFDNLLAASHAQILNHGHDRDIRTPATAENPIKLETPVGARGWDHEVGEKLVWMVGRQDQRAELVLNPPQLGRVEVSLSINGDQTNATFVAANPAVRDALESALPRLREMFADAGLSLGQAQVGADSGKHAANQSAGNGGNRDNSSSFSNALNGPLDDTMLRLTGSSQWSRQGRGMVDVFA